MGQNRQPADRRYFGYCGAPLSSEASRAASACSQRSFLCLSNELSNKICIRQTLAMNTISLSASLALGFSLMIDRYSTGQIFELLCEAIRVCSSPSVEFSTGTTPKFAESDSTALNLINRFQVRFRCVTKLFQYCRLGKRALRPRYAAVIFCSSPKQLDIISLNIALTCSARRAGVLQTSRFRTNSYLGL